MTTDRHLVAEIEIPGEPVAQGRPKAGRWKAKDGRSGIALRDPAKSRNWKATAQGHMIAQIGVLTPLIAEGPIRLELDAYFTCPKSDHRKRAPRPLRRHVKRPDLDNLVKAAKDAGSGLLWLDDSQVCETAARKFIAAQGEAPRLVLRIFSLGELEVVA